MKKGTMKKGAKIAWIVAAVLVVVLAAGLGTAWKLLNPEVAAKTPVSASASSEQTQGVRYIAHRGFSAVAPENSLPAITEAGKAGFWGAEFDIHQTTDGKWVLMHDDYLFRMTDGLGKISKYSYTKLQKYTFDNGANHEQYPSLRIPLLDDVLDECVRYGLHPCIEIKKEVPVENLNSFVRLLREKKLEKSCTVLSFSLDQLKRMRELDDSVTLWYLVDDITDEAIEACKTYRIDGVDFDARREANTPAVIQKITDAGLVPAAWTIDDIALHDELVRQGIEYITTNVIQPA